jgi:hypothetical protein
MGSRPAPQAKIEMTGDSCRCALDWQPSIREKGNSISVVDTIEAIGYIAVI